MADRESTLSTPSGMNTNISNDLIYPDSQNGGCSQKWQRKKSLKMLEAEDSSYLIQTGKLFEMPRSRKPSHQESPPAGVKRRRVSSNASRAPISNGDEYLPY